MPTPIKKRKIELDMDFREKIFDNLKTFYEMELLCNITLIAGIDQQRIQAHRVILAAASPYFRAMFTNDLKEKHQTEITLKEIHGGNLKTIVDFCYSGRIEINEENMLGLLEIASRLEFTYIENECFRFISELLNVSNCLAVWTGVDPFANFRPIVQSAIKVAEDNFVDIVKQHEFSLLRDEKLWILLASDQLNVWCEEEVFNALMTWVEYDEESRSAVVPDLMLAIRLTHLRPKFIFDTVAKFCQKYNCSEITKDVFLHKILPETMPLSSIPRPSTTAKRLIVFGNRSNSAAENWCTEIYCPITQKWSDMPEFICPQSGFCTLVMNNELYIIGGWSNGCNEALDLVKKYNFSSKEWTDMNPMHVSRCWFGAAELNGNIYAGGGKERNSVERFNLQTGHWNAIASMLEKRRYFSYAAINGRLFAVGGDNKTNGRLDTVECYNEYKNKWKFVASMNHRRSSHGVLVSNGYLYAVGGLGAAGIEDSVELYDPVIDKWSLIEMIKIPRYGFSATVSDNEIIVAGGKLLGKHTMSSIIKIDLNGNVAEDMPAMNRERSSFAIIEMPRYDPHVKF